MLMNIVAGLAAFLLSTLAAARQADIPWGVSSSSSSTRNHAEWFPRVYAAGARSVRLFPEWGGTQPAADTWRWDATDALVRNAAESRIDINAVLMGVPAWST